MKKIMDGNEACARVAYEFSEVIPVYPITPSTAMAELCDEWRNGGKQNIFGQVPDLVEMQSEAGVAGTLHGIYRAGSLGTTFTASQGLLLMIPNMFKMAGECLPAVIHISARTVATHALNIYGDHSDVMACRGTGFAMLASASPQQAQDFALVAHLSAIESGLPFMHFFDGFRTSHELNIVETVEESQIKSLVDFEKIEKFRQRGLSNSHPEQSGTNQGSDVFFANREACNVLYNALPNIVQNNFDKLATLTGRQYHLFDYYGSPTARNVVVIMASGGEVVQEVLENLGESAQDFGVVCVRLYRPFSVQNFVECLPKTVQNICVLDRTKECGAIGEPLFCDVATAVQQAGLNVKVLGGRYGIGGFEFNPAMVKAVFDNMISQNPKNNFSVGIIDDVTNNSLEIDDNFEIQDNNKKCVFFGLGGDGTISANKNSAKIINDKTRLFTQGFFVYDSKKSGSMTISHLRFGDKPIKSSYKIDKADFVAVHNPTFLSKVDVLKYLKPNGMLLLNIPITDGKITLPQSVAEKIQKLQAQVYAIDADALALQNGLKGKINVIMQTAFFKIINLIDFEVAKQELINSATKTYAKFGEQTIKNNINAINSTCEKIIKISKNNIIIDKNIGKNAKNCDKNDYFQNIIKKIAELNGEEIPVSKFCVDGITPTDTSQFEKRGIATQLPQWVPENCIQCNLCSLVCPHSAIEPKLIDDKIELKCPHKIAMGETNKNFAISCSPLDCTGCGNCEKICPARNKAIVMKPASEIQEQLLHSNEELSKVVNQKVNNLNIKTSQFVPSLFKYSGACAGCGQTPYIKLLTQLFGEQLMIANATGCSSIFGGTFPSCPYAKTPDGFGPAWANSLFEDNAEFGLGLKLARDKQVQRFNEVLKVVCQKNEKINKIVEKYNKNDEKSDKIDKNYNKNIDFYKNKELYFELKQYFNDNIITEKIEQDLMKMLDIVLPSSQWIIGGDGWAYDIGYGGLDHILASNYDVNILVLDTEIYSNTGGQSSKSTPQGATAKLCASGKQTAKKDLARLASIYPNTYVAKVCLSANPAHTLKCFVDAKNHNGPSIIIAYAPCVGQGANLSQTPNLEKLAVSSGYWELLHRNPSENADIIIDSPQPTTPLDEFLSLHTRFKKLIQEE